MARLARIVAPGYPHLVVQRGRDATVFESLGDHSFYRDLLAARCRESGVAVWAYALLPTRVLLVMVPGDGDGLRRALADTDRRYSRHLNRRTGRDGRLWRERFHSFPIDEAHLAAVVRYVEMAPVRDGLVRQPEAWPWSSAAPHLAGRDDGLVGVAPMLARAGAWPAFLSADVDAETLERIHAHERTGRPLGNDDFVSYLEGLTGRVLRVARRSRALSPAEPATAPTPSAPPARARRRR